MMDKYSFWHGFFYGISVGFLGLFFALQFTLNNPEFHFTELPIANMKGDRIDGTVLLKGKPVIVLLVSKKYKKLDFLRKTWDAAWRSKMDDFSFVFLTDMPIVDIKKWDKMNDIRFPMYFSRRLITDYPINDMVSVLLFDKSGSMLVRKNSLESLKDFEDFLETYQNEIND